MAEEYLIYGNDDACHDILSHSEYNYGDESTKIITDDAPPQVVNSSLDAKEDYPYISVPDYRKDDIEVTNPVYDIEYIKLLILKTFVEYDGKYSSMVQEKLDSIYPYVSSQVTNAFSSYYQGILNDISSASSSALSESELYTDSAAAMTLSASSEYTDAASLSIRGYIAEVATNVYSSATLSAADYTDYIRNQIDSIISANDTDYRRSNATLATAITSLSAVVDDINSRAPSQLTNIYSSAVYSSSAYANGLVDRAVVTLKQYADVQSASAIESSNGYADTIASSAMGVATDASNRYTDTVVGSASSGTLSSANRYTDTSVSSLSASLILYSNNVYATSLQYTDTSTNNLSAAIIEREVQQLAGFSASTLSAAKAYTDAGVASSVDTSETYAINAAREASEAARIAAAGYTDSSIEDASKSLTQSIITYAGSAYSASTVYADITSQNVATQLETAISQSYVSACNYANAVSGSAVQVAYLSTVASSANSVAISRAYTDGSVHELSQTIPDLVKSAYSGIAGTIQDSNITMTDQTGPFAGVTLYDFYENLKAKMNNNVILHSYTYYSMMDDMSDADDEVIYVAKVRGSEWVVKKALVSVDPVTILYASSYSSGLTVDQAMASPAGLNYMTLNELNI